MSSPSALYNGNMDDLRSTWSQRAWTLAVSAGILASLTTSAFLAASSGSFTSLAGAACAAFAAYSFADLATGFYHWAIDNYGDATTPLLGAQIKAFQGHHRHPYTIVRRELCNNLHVAARAVAVVLPAADAALYAAGVPVAAHVFVDVLAACLVLSQQFHVWAHEKPRRLPRPVAALQAAGVFLSREHHAEHHRPPYDTNYCIISGMWNGVLDGFKVFRGLEEVIYLCTGIRPRSWDTPDAKWREHGIDDAGN
ncbi:hypothetical protein EJB05_47426, partial [Eragrostis curvula]